MDARSPPPPANGPVKGTEGPARGTAGNSREYLELQWFRKILVSIKFLSAILGPEMAAPILWTRGKIALFLQENPCP